jgi:hypothetical protein
VLPDCFNINNTFDNVYYVHRQLLSVDALGVEARQHPPSLGGQGGTARSAREGLLARSACKQRR